MTEQGQASKNEVIPTEETEATLLGQVTDTSKAQVSVVAVSFPLSVVQQCSPPLSSYNLLYYLKGVLIHPLEQGSQSWIQLKYFCLESISQCGSKHLSHLLLSV